MWLTWQIIHMMRKKARIKNTFAPAGNGTTLEVNEKEAATTEAQKWVGVFSR